jgi:opacity protein-like surface antigen
MLARSFAAGMTLSVAVTVLFTGAAQAVDVTLLGGIQGNQDFELAEFDEAGGAPDTAEPGDDVTLEAGPAVGLAVDFVFDNNPDQRIGFFLTHHRADFGSEAGLEDSQMDITHLHFTAMNYYPRGSWEPFVLAGVGAAHFSPADDSLDSSTRVSAQIGGGANYKISESLLLRLEARWIPTFFNGSSAGICSGGCTIALKSDMYSQFQANIGLQFRF